MSEPTDAAQPRLGAFDATMLVMGGIIGVGIFFTPQSVAQLVPSPGLQLLLWGLGAVVALCGAATFAELGGTFPRAGGWFEFLREIYGPLAAFLCGLVRQTVESTSKPDASHRLGMAGTTPSGRRPDSWMELNRLKADFEAIPRAENWRSARGSADFEPPAAR